MRVLLLGPGARYSFNVTLFLVRPNDQTLQAEFSRSNILCQVNRRSGGGTRVLMLPIYQRGLGGSGGAGTRAARSAASRRAARTAARTRPRSCGGGTSPPAPRTSPTPPPTTPTPRAAPSSGEPGKYLDQSRKIFMLRLFPAPPPTSPSCQRCGLSPPTCPPSRVLLRQCIAAT